MMLHELSSGGNRQSKYAFELTYTQRKYIELPIVRYIPLVRYSQPKSAVKTTKDGNG